jgi:hypothetical protein
MPSVYSYRSASALTYDEVRAVQERLTGSGMKFDSPEVDWATVLCKSSAPVGIHRQQVGLVFGRGLVVGEEAAEQTLEFWGDRLPREGRMFLHYALRYQALPPAPGEHSTVVAVELIDGGLHLGFFPREQLHANPAVAIPVLRRLLAVAGVRATVEPDDLCGIDVTRQDGGTVKSPHGPASFLASLGGGPRAAITAVRSMVSELGAVLDHCRWGVTSKGARDSAERLQLLRTMEDWAPERFPEYEIKFKAVLEEASSVIESIGRHGDLEFPLYAVRKGKKYVGTMTAVTLGGELFLEIVEPNLTKRGLEEALGLMLIARRE